MFIPKQKMHVITHALDIALKDTVFNDEERELLAQIADRAALCQQGDAPWLQVEVCYANKPE